MKLVSKCVFFSLFVCLFVCACSPGGGQKVCSESKSAKILSALLFFLNAPLCYVSLDTDIGCLSQLTEKSHETVCSIKTGFVLAGTTVLAGIPALSLLQTFVR